MAAKLQRPPEAVFVNAWLSKHKTKQTTPQQKLDVADVLNVVGMKVGNYRPIGSESRQEDEGIRMPSIER